MHCGWVARMRGFASKKQATVDRTRQISALMCLTGLGAFSIPSALVRTMVLEARLYSGWSTRHTSVDGLMLLQADNCNYQIPAKAYEYIRSGKPVLALTPQEGEVHGVADAPLGAPATKPSTVFGFWLIPFLLSGGSV